MRIIKDMKTIKIIAILAGSLLFAAVSAAVASDFRCGSKIITIGSHKYDVLRRCGDPSHMESWEEVRIRRDFGSGLLDPERVIHLRPQIVEELVTIEEWEYNLGSNQFIRYLRFENGRLTRITIGDYGY